MTRRRDPSRRARASGKADRADTPLLRLREPADVLGAIPYIVGYHPRDSVVVFAMRGTELIFTMRDDIPGEAVVDEVVEDLVRLVLAHHADAVVLVAYGEDDQVRPVLLGLRDACERAGLAVREILRAAGGRHWSYLCQDPDCCPADGTPYDGGTSPVAAQATFAGRVVLPDRAAYEAQVSPVGGSSRVSMGQATVRADERLMELLAGPVDEDGVMDALEDAGRMAIDNAISRQRAGGRLDDDEVAWLTVLLTSIPVRDIAWAQITGPAEELEHHRALWMDVTQRVEPDLVMAPGSLFAFASWRCGETSLARIALERVLDEDPTYNMAVLLTNTLAHGLPPSVLREWPGPGLSARDLTWRGLSRRPDRPRRRRSSSRRAGSRQA